MADVNFAQLADDFFMTGEADAVFDSAPMQTDPAAAAGAGDLPDRATPHAMARMPPADEVSIHDSAAAVFDLSFDQHYSVPQPPQFARSPPDEGDTLYAPPAAEAPAAGDPPPFVLPEDPPMLAAAAARQSAPLALAPAAACLPAPQEDSSSSDADGARAGARASAAPAPQVGRVDASKMPEVPNPLDKAGRHTVIVGHLPASNAYSVAATQLGVKMVSRAMRAAGPDALASLSRPEAFTRDLQEFLSEISAPAYKAPVIGGGLLDLFQLVLEVLRLGGVENVVASRAFRIVGQQLELPMTCTSAAYVLKNAYNRLLYYYERMLVHDEYPEDGARNVDIKSIVQQKKQGAKAARRAGTKRRAGDAAAAGEGSQAGKATMSALEREMTPANEAAFKRMRVGADGDETATVDAGEDYVQRYMDVMASSALPEYRLPEWAQVVADERHYQAFIDACFLIDDQRAANTPIDVVLVAFAHCFERSSASISRTDPMAPDRTRHALALRILKGPTGPRFPAATALLTLVTKLHDLPPLRRPVLSPGPSGTGLLCGLVGVLDAYHESVLAPLQCSAHARLLRLSKAPEAPAASFRLVSAAYVAATALDELAQTPGTLSRLAASGGLARALVGILSTGAAHEAIETQAWSLLARIADSDDTCAHRGYVLAQWLAKEALLRLELGGCEADDGRVERERRFVANAVAGVGGFARRFHADAHVAPMLDLAARVLRIDPERAGGALADAALVEQIVPSALMLAYSLAARCPQAAREHSGLVRALIRRMARGGPASFGDAALVVLHRTRQLKEYAGDIVDACSALQPRSQVLEVVQEIVTDLFVGKCEMEDAEMVDEMELSIGKAVGDAREIPHEENDAAEIERSMEETLVQETGHGIEQEPDQEAGVGAGQEVDVGQEVGTGEKVDVQQENVSGQEMEARQDIEAGQAVENDPEAEQVLDEGNGHDFFLGGDDLIVDEQHES